MADRYGTDMEFKKEAEAMLCKASEDYKGSVRKGGLVASTVASTESNNTPAPVSFSNAKEFDKSKWEYWEKHARKTFNDCDGRTVIIGEKKDIESVMKNIPM